MNFRREATKTIWKTVVFAGAMLGSAGCHKTKAPATTPAATPTTESTPTEAKPDETTPTADGTEQTNPCGEQADPCGDRPRGIGEEGNVGRGFLLS